jgi:hypothetical protein
MTAMTVRSVRGDAKDTDEALLRSHQEIGGNRVDMLLYAAIRPSG